MANRHKKCGGGVGKAKVSFGNMDVIQEARKKRKDGGEVGKVAGRAAGGRLDRKSGGKVNKATGGSLGKSPFSSAGGGSADKSPFFK